MRAPAVIVIVSIFCISTTVAQDSAAAEPYDLDDAYQIYSLLLPHEESYGFAKGTLVIQEEAVSKPEESGACLTREAANQLKDAIDDYNRLHRKKWLLKRRFQIEKPYEIVSLDTIAVLFKQDGWDGFYKRYPDSGGYVIMSTVGFNKEKTRAIVYTGSSCGSLCGRWLFHLLEKVDGNWKEVPGVSCVTVS